jgi:hypothetical protein
MRWFTVTMALLAASAALVGGIYLRDRASSDWLPPGGPVAHHDAMAIAAAIGGTCPRDCVVEMLAHPKADHWTERIRIPTATECVDIDIRTFATAEVNGFSGVTKVGCARGPDQP